MRKKLYCIMSIVLALIICTPRVTVQALADDGSAPATSTPVSSLAALAPAATGAVGHDQADVAGAPATSTPGSSSASLAPAATGTVGHDQADVAESVDLGIAQPAALRSPSALRGVELPNVVTSAHVTTATGTTPVNVGPWQAFKINFHYVLPNLTVHEGDTTTIELPAGFKSAAPTDFVIKDGDNIIARGKTDPTNTKYIITYTSYVEGKSDISGDFVVNTQIDNDVHTQSGVLPVNPVVSGEMVPAGSVNYTVHTETALPIIKSGWAHGFDTTRGVWQIKINQDGKEYIDAVLEDTLLTPGVSIIPGSLEVFEGAWQLQGTSFKLVGQTDVTNQYVSNFTSTDTTFRLRLGHIPASKGLLVRFQTKISYTPLPGERFENKGTLSDGGASKESKAHYLFPSAGGVGEGYNYTINIKKTDDASAPLAGAVFDIVRTRTGAVVGQVTTNASGEASLSGLLRDGYTIKETTPPSGYLAADDQTVAGTDFPFDTKSVTRTFVDKLASSTVDVAVEKVWNDAGDQDGIRPAEITVKLLANGADTGKTVTLNSAGSWKDIFQGLDDKDALGNDITYTVAEDPVPSKYTSETTGSAAAGYTITNSHVPETVNVPVIKSWIGPKGSEVTVKLLADGAEVAGKALKLNAGNNWTGSFDNLPKYNHGTEIAYTVTEDQVSGVDSSKYETSVAGDASSGYTITNKNVETLDISGTKTWDDDGDRDGVRPSSITVNLIRDGVKIDSASVSPDASGAWLYGFTGLYKYDQTDGHPYTYAVTENAVPGYATALSGTDITNTRTPGKTSVTAIKAWADGNDRDGIRPASVNVQLYANGAVSGAPVTLNTANSWSYTWTNLNQKENGRDVVYTVKEVTTPDGYESQVSGDAVSGFTITNSHVPETVNVPVIKSWIGPAGTEVTIHLLADGHDTGKALKLNAGNNWTGSFDNLPKYNHGTEIAYAVTEDPVDGYKSEIFGDTSAGFTVTNTKAGNVPSRPDKNVPSARGPAPLLPKTGAGNTMLPAALLAALAALFAAVLVCRREPAGGGGITGRRRRRNR